MMHKNDKIFVAGHRGLVGSAITNILQNRGFTNLILKTRQELNLLDPVAVKSFFQTHKPDVVFLAAARVGGIYANNTYRADFIYENLTVQNNVIWNAHQNNTRRLIFLGSSCIYPKNASQPMKETCLLTSPLEYTNRPYALAKIAGVELIETLRKQHNRDYFSVMPTNLYGPGDNFHPENSHVLPALIDRFLKAKQKNESTVTLWGSGKPLREFMYSLDCADAIVFLAEHLTQDIINQSEIGKAGWSHVNIGSGQEISIADLGNLIADIVNFKGKIIYDPSKPDGTLRKLLDCLFLKQMGWEAKITLREGISTTIQEFVIKKNQKKYSTFCQSKNIPSEI